jgi:WD40 repeat protein
MRPGCKFEKHTERVSGIIHLPSGQRMMTCSWDGSLRIWDLQSGTQIGNDWRDGKSAVNTIGLSLDGKKVASGSDDGAVRLWDVDTGKVIAKLAGDHNQSGTQIGNDWRDGKSAVNTIGLSLDGKTVASGSDDGAVRLWDVDTGKVIAKLAGGPNPIISVCWNRDGGRVVSGTYAGGTARVWGVESGKTVLAIETGFSSMGSVIYSPDTTMIATGEYRREGEGEEYVKIWDAKTGKLVANLKGHTGGINCLAWTADGKTLISGSDDHSIRTWNATTWLQTAVWTGHTGTVYGIAISPNGRILASASYDNTARLWNLENGQPIGSPLQHDSPLYCVSFSMDGKLLATGCDDKNAYAWDMSVVLKEAGLSDLLKPNVS